MRRLQLCMLVTVTVCGPGGGHTDEVYHATFEDTPSDALLHTWGDEPAEVLANQAEPGAGRDGAGAHLSLRFGDETPNDLTYWNLRLNEPIPIVSGLETVSFWVKANAPVGIKIGIGTFGFIYHGPMVGPSDEWQEVAVADAYDELTAWCAGGKRSADDGFITDIIIAVADTKQGDVDVFVDDVAVVGAEGVTKIIRDEASRRRFKRINASVVTLPWSDEGRALETVLDRLDEAGHVGSDIVCLPMECVKTDGEPIPGPTSNAIAAKAAEHSMYVVGNLRETDADKTFVTSFLCDRSGEITGKYRKSHKMPDENMDLGDELPVFDTDFGPIAMRIGTDRFFADIDHCYTAQGARMIFWSQQPEPIEDEYSQDTPSLGRAADYNVFIACARYSRAESGWITNKFPPYRGSPIGRSYIVNREGQRVASTTRKGSVAIAPIPFAQLRGPGRSANHNPAFAALTQPLQLPPEREWSKRRVRVSAIENHPGIDELLAKLDECGKLGTDIACTYEFVWISGGPEEQVKSRTEVAKENLRRVAAKAKQWGMYILIAGVIDRLERNEAIIYGRDGEEVGRYFKIAQTHDEQIVGEETPVFETDFGRIACRICADEWMVELDRCYGVKGADILFTPTQSWAPDAIHRDLRDISRCMDAQMFHVQATHSGTETIHRSQIIEPTGVPVARTEYRSNGIVSAVVDLDADRPMRYLRNWSPHEPGGYLPEFQDTEVPEVRNDLKLTILQQRRPELYGVLAPTPPGETP